MFLINSELKNTNQNFLGQTELFVHSSTPGLGNGKK